MINMAASNSYFAARGGVVVVVLVAVAAVTTNHATTFVSAYAAVPGLANPFFHMWLFAYMLCSSLTRHLSPIGATWTSC